MNSPYFLVTEDAPKNCQILRKVFAALDNKTSETARANGIIQQ